jgi:hypothetical protein
MRQHTSASVRIRQDTSGYVRIRQDTSVGTGRGSTRFCQSLYVCTRKASKLRTCQAHRRGGCAGRRQYLYFCTSEASKLSTKLSTKRRTCQAHHRGGCAGRLPSGGSTCSRSSPVAASYVSIRQHTSAYVSIRQHASACVSIQRRLDELTFFTCVS